jgi:glyoxylase-like metal-dependent hydrolase (beta-lactamase superfamily II)
MPLLGFLAGLSLGAVAGAAPPTPRALVDSAIAAMQHGAALADVRSLRLVGVQHDFMLGNAERAEGPWRVMYSVFNELRDPAAGALRRTERGVGPTGLSSDRVTIVHDTVVAYATGGRVVAGSHGAFEDIVDRIDGSPERALMLARESGALVLDGTVKRFGLTYDVVAFPWRNGRMKIELNRETHLPDAVVIVRKYPDNFRWDAFGTVTMRADYVDWTLSPSGVYWPMQTKVSLNGEPLRDITISTVSLDPSRPAADSFAVADSTRAQFARNSALNFSRFAFGARGQPTELAPGIVRVPDQWAMTLVKQPDGVVIFEAHISGRYFADVVAEAKRRWPDAPIKAVVMTSDPWAHLGGLHEVVARGIPIYVNARSVPFLTRVAGAGKRPRFVPIASKTVIGQGENSITLYPVGGPYAERMLMAYFPGQKLLYGADLVFPNRGPDGRPAPGFLETPAENLHAAVARERLEVDRVFCVQNYAPFAWSDFVAPVAIKG